MESRPTDGATSEEVQRVVVPRGRDKRLFLVQVSLSMLSAPGGDFDQDDTVFADISHLDGQPVGGPPFVGPYWEGDPIGGANVMYHGAGVWGHHCGDLGWHDTLAPGALPAPSWITRGPNPRNMRTSSLIAEITDSVDFRLVVTGDDWAGATYLVLEI